MKSSLSRYLSAAIALTILVAPSAAMAQETIGNRLSEILKNVWSPTFLLISAAALILGLALFVRGLMKLKDAGNDSGNKNALSEGLMHLFAATMLVSLPEVAGIGLSTIFGGSYNIFGSMQDFSAISNSLDIGPHAGSGLGGAHSSAGGFLSSARIGAPDNCYASNEPSVCMARNLAKNVVPMGILTVFALMFLIGLWTFASAVADVARSQANGGRKPGWAAKLVIGVLMMNGPVLFYTATNTLLGMGGVISSQGFDSSSSLLSYSATFTSADFLQKYAQLVGYVMVILAFFGVWAFMRGLLSIKTAAEGRGQVTYGHGAVFMVAGILLANAKFTTCMVLNTVGGSGMTAGFCS